MTLKDIKEKVSPALERTWDDNLKQHYLEYERDGAKYKMWLEDEQSIEEKVKLIPQYNLAGVAAWAKDMETDNIWGVINENMNK